MSKITPELSSLKSLLSEDEFSLLVKYKARKKYVTGLESTNIVGLSHSVSEGYFAMLKLSLSFSAVEMLCTVISRKGNLGIRHQRFTEALNEGLFDKLLQGIDNDSKRRYPRTSHTELESWKSLPADADLTKFIYQCRNYMFHGSFTPSEAGLTSVRLRSLLLELSLATLDAGEDALLTWTRKQLRNRG